MEKGNLMTAAETAARLRCSVMFIYQLAASGELSSIKLGKLKGLRFTPEAVEEFLRQRTTNTKGADAAHDSGNGGR